MNQQILGNSQLAVMSMLTVTVGVQSQWLQLLHPLVVPHLAQHSHGMDILWALSSQLSLVQPLRCLLGPVGDLFNPWCLVDHCL